MQLSESGSIYALLLYNWLQGLYEMESIGTYVLEFLQNDLI